MGSNSSKHSKHNSDRGRESRTRKNMRSADRLERDRYSDNSYFHRKPDYEDIRSRTLDKAHGMRISAPIPASLPTMPASPAPVYHKHLADRRPPPPPKSSRASSSVFTVASAVPAPLNIRKRAPASTPAPTTAPTRSSSSKRSRDVPSTGRPMFPPSMDGSSEIPGSYYPPTSSKTKKNGSSSRRARSRSPSRQHQPPPSPSRQRQPPSSSRHGPSTARYPPSSDRAPPPLSSRNILPQAQPRGYGVPLSRPRSERRRVTREDVRGRQ